MQAKHPVQQFNGVRFYRKPNGYYKADWKKHRGIYMHRFVWESIKGPIQPGFHIHHKDGNRSNNAIENLELISHSEHSRLHYAERKETDPNWWLNGAEQRQAGARQWHQSTEGRAWHSKHGKESWKDREILSRNCDHCGTEYQYLAGSLKNGTGFCGKNCVSAARRKAGVDNIQRSCVICGSIFSVNRYRKTKTCSATCKKKVLSESRKSVRPNGG